MAATASSVRWREAQMRRLRQYRRGAPSIRLASRSEVVGVDARGEEPRQLLTQLLVGLPAVEDEEKRSQIQRHNQEEIRGRSEGDDLPAVEDGAEHHVAAPLEELGIRPAPRLQLRVQARAPRYLPHAESGSSAESGPREGARRARSGAPQTE